MKVSPAEKRRRGRPKHSHSKGTSTKKSSTTNVVATTKVMDNKADSIIICSDSNSSLGKSFVDVVTLSDTLTTDASDSSCIMQSKVSGICTKLKDARVVLQNIFHSKLISPKQRTELLNKSFNSEHSKPQTVSKKKKQKKKKTKPISISSATSDSSIICLGPTIPIERNTKFDPQLTLMKVKVESSPKTSEIKTCRARRSSVKSVEKKPINKKQPEPQTILERLLTNGNKTSSDRPVSIYSSSSSEQLETKKPKKESRNTKRSRSETSFEDRSSLDGSLKAERSRSKKSAKRRRKESTEVKNKIVKTINSQNSSNESSKRTPKKEAQVKTDSSNESSKRTPKKEAQVKTDANVSKKVAQGSDFTGSPKTPLKNVSDILQNERSPPAPNITVNMQQLVNFCSPGSNGVGIGNYINEPPILSPKIMTIAPPLACNNRAEVEIRPSDHSSPTPCNTRSEIEIRPNNRSPPTVCISRTTVEIRADDILPPTQFASSETDVGLDLDEKDCCLASIALAIENDLAAGNRLSPIGDIENMEMPPDLATDTCCLRKMIINGSTTPDHPELLQQDKEKSRNISERGSDSHETSSNISSSTVASGSGRKRKRPAIIKDDILPKGTIPVSSKLPVEKKQRISSSTVVPVTTMNDQKINQNLSTNGNNAEFNSINQSNVNLPSSLHDWSKCPEIAPLLQENTANDRQNVKHCCVIDDALNNNQEVNFTNKNTDKQEEKVTLYALPREGSPDFMSEFNALQSVLITIEDTNNLKPVTEDKDCLEIENNEQEIDEAIESFNASVNLSRIKNREKAETRSVASLTVENVDKFTCATSKSATASKFASPARTFDTDSSRECQSEDIAECSSGSTKIRRRKWIPIENITSPPAPRRKIRLNRGNWSTDRKDKSEFSSAASVSYEQSENCLVTRQNLAQEPNKNDVTIEYSQKVINQTLTNNHFRKPSSPAKHVQKRDNIVCKAAPKFGEGTLAGVPEGKSATDENSDESSGSSSSSSSSDSSSSSSSSSSDSDSSDDEAASQKVVEKVAEKVTEIIPEKATEKVSEKVTEIITKNATGKVSEMFTEKIPEKATGKVSEKVTEIIPKKATGKVSEMFTEKIPEKATRKVNENVFQKIPKKIIDNVSQNRPTHAAKPENSRAFVSTIKSRGIETTKADKVQLVSQKVDDNEAAGSLINTDLDSDKNVDDQDDCISLFADSAIMSRCGSPPLNEPPKHRKSPLYKRMKSSNIDYFANANKKQCDVDIAAYKQKVNNDKDDRKQQQNKKEQKTVNEPPPNNRSMPNLEHRNEIQNRPNPQTYNNLNLRLPINGTCEMKTKHFFFGQCFPWLKFGMCNQAACRYLHVLKPQLQRIGSYPMEIIVMILRDSIAHRYRYFIDIVHSQVVANMTTEQIFYFYRDLYHCRLLTDTSILSTTDALLQRGMSLKDVVTIFDQMLVGGDQELPPRLIYILSKKIKKPDTLWETLGKLISKTLPPLWLIELLIEECINEKKSKEHVSDLYENLIKGLPIDFARNIRNNLLMRFHDFRKTSVCPDPSVIKSVELPDEPQQNGVIACSIASPDPVEQWVGHTLPEQLAEVEKSMTVLKPTPKILENGECNLAEKKSKTTSRSASRRSGTDSQTSDYSIAPIDDLPLPKSPYRDVLWKFHWDLQGVQEGLKHRDYTHVISILTKNVEHPSRLPHMAGFYNILCHEITSSEHHLKQIVHLTVQTGASNELRQFVFDLGILVLTKLADIGAWVLAHELLKTLQVYGTYNTCAYTLLAAEIYIANYRPLKALELLKQSQLVFANPKVWNQMWCRNDEPLRVSVMELLLSSLCDGHAQHALLFLEFILNDQCSSFKPINVSRYVDKVARALLAEKHTDSIIDFGRVVMQANLLIRRSTFRALINAIFHNDRFLAKQLHRYATWLGAYNTPKIGLNTHLVINDDWSEEELFLMFSSLIKDLSTNIGHAIDRLRPRQLAVFLILETIPTEKDLRLDICNGPMTNTQINKRKAIVRNVLDHFDPKIKLVQKSHGRICKVQSTSLVNYLKAGHFEH